MPNTVNLKKFEEALRKSADMLSKEEAHRRNICAVCRKPWRSRTHTPEGIREYNISGMCEECFDALFVS